MNTEQQDQVMIWIGYNSRNILMYKIKDTTTKKLC